MASRWRRLPSLPKEKKLIKPDEAAKLDRLVLQCCFSESYLHAPLRGAR